MAEIAWDTALSQIVALDDARVLLSWHESSCIQKFELFHQDGLRHPLGLNQVPPCRLVGLDRPGRRPPPRSRPWPLATP